MENKGVSVAYKTQPKHKGKWKIRACPWHTKHNQNMREMENKGVSVAYEGNGKIRVCLWHTKHNQNMTGNGK